MFKFLTIAFLTAEIFTSNLEASCCINYPIYEKVSEWDDQTELRSMLREQAAIEFKDDQYKSVILEYIDMILDDGILDDPEAYLQAWAEARGVTRELRIPEDPAHGFFIKYLQCK